MHSRSAETGVYTTSDFLLTSLSQQALAGNLAHVRKDQE
jgi:hypothetical protein